jgi:hypothetical protein
MTEVQASARAGGLSVPDRGRLLDATPRARQGALVRGTFSGPSVSVKL